MTDTVEEMTKLKFVKKQDDDPLPFGLEDGESGFFIATLDGCGHCENMKQKLHEQLNNGQIREIHSSENEDRPDEIKNLMLMMENDITAFPTIFEVKRQGDKHTLCEMDPETKKPSKCRVVKQPTEED